MENAITLRRLVYSCIHFGMDIIAPFFIVPHRPEERSPSPVQQCVSQICAHWKLLAVIAVVIAVIIASTTLLIIQNQKISAIEDKLAHEARVSDIQVYEKLLEEIRQLEKNITDRALQLENLDSLEGRVDHLEDTAAKKNELSSLEHEVTNHISDSQSTHGQLSSRISSNVDDIGSNMWRIGVAESDIDQLQGDVADSSPGLKPFWTILIVLPAITVMVV